MVLSSLPALAVTLGGLLCFGVVSSPARAEVPPPVDAGVAAAAADSSRVKDVPLTLMRDRKLSVNDEPHLPESIKQRYVCNVLLGRYRFCVGTDGAVSSVDTLVSIPGADVEISRAIKGWRFKPSSRAMCAVQTLNFDIPGPDVLCNQPKPVQRTWLDERQQSGDALRLPGVVLPQSALGKTAVYKFCINRQGMVTTVVALRGLAGVDRGVIDIIKRWNYGPLPLVACAFEVLRVTLDAAGKPSLATEAQARLIGSEETKLLNSPSAPLPPRTVPAIQIFKEKLSGDDPHLPDSVKQGWAGQIIKGSYKLCIARDGLISAVDVVSSIPDADEQIIETLSTWRYKSQNLPVCFVQFLEFHIAGPE